MTPPNGPKPYFYSRATVELLLLALKEAEARHAPRDTSYSIVSPRRAPR